MTGRAPRTPAVSPSSADIDRACALCLRPAPGKLAGFFGTGAHRLALRAMARPLLAGEPAVVVDGGNRFDPYEIVKAERALGESGRAALSRILVSRAFTCHQMEALLSARLGPALERSGATVAVVFGLPETFTDADVPYGEACRVFRNCLSSLRRLAAGGTRVVLVGSCPPAAGAPPPAAGGDRSGFFRHLVRIADPCLLLHGEGDAGKATLRGGTGACAGGRSRRGVSRNTGNAAGKGRA